MHVLQLEKQEYTPVLALLLVHIPLPSTATVHKAAVAPVQVLHPDKQESHLLPFNQYPSAVQSPDARVIGVYTVHVLA